MPEPVKKSAKMTNPNQTRVALGMSGGIDSSVAALLLRKAGYQVVGLTMQIWDPRVKTAGGKGNACYGPDEEEDIEAARQVAANLDIPHYTVPLQEEYTRFVLDWYRDRYLAGVTPNPCAVCNPTIKFGWLLDKAQQMGVEFEYFATGHYVRRRSPERTGEPFRLYRGVDPAKDQSYFLARLSQAQLARSLFPLGEMNKQQVRRLATDMGLEKLLDKAESQDFFAADDTSVLFPAEQVRPGPIIDTSGRRLGAHRGIVHYTVGQREGLGVATGRRVYVKEIRAESNTIVLAEREEVMNCSCRVLDPRWIAGPPRMDGRELSVRLRYRHCGAPAQVWYDRKDNICRVEFAEPQFAIAPGQMAAFYDGEQVLGGGWIARP